MNVYTYHYTCPRWYGTATGTRHLYLEGSLQPEDAARRDAESVTGSTECDIHLIQKYTMVVQDVETYPAMACLPLHKCKDDTTQYFN